MILLHLISSVLVAAEVVPPSAQQLSCLFHLPIDLYRQGQTSSSAETSELIFPTPETVEKCLQLNRALDKPQWMGEVKFCLAQLRMDLGEFAGMPPDPHRWLTHVTLTAGVCLPEDCQANDLAAVLSYLCAIPDCGILAKRELIQVCWKMQTVACGPLNPHLFEHELLLQCLEDTESSPILMVSDSKNDNFIEAEPVMSDSIEEAIMNAEEMKNLLGVKDEDLLKEDDIQLMGTLTPWDSEISRDDLNVLMNCGFRAVENFALWQASGTIGTLGDWDTCPGADVAQPAAGSPGHYCTLRYMGLMVAGRCVPHECSEDHLIKLLQMICMYTGGPERPRNCLDFVNVIPLDMCLSTQLFGCGDLSAFLNTTQSPGFAELITGTLARADLPTRPSQIAPDIRQAIETAGTVINSVLGPAIANKIGPLLKNYPVADFAHTQRFLEKIINDTLSQLPAKYRPNDMRRRLGPQVEGLTVRTFCEFCQKPTTRNVLMLTAAVALSALAFVILPLGGWCAHKKRRPQELNVGLVNGGERPPMWRKLLSCFAFSPNLESYIRNTKKVEEGDFPHLSGIRVISMVWICLGHTICFAVLQGPIGNLPFVFELLKRPDFQLIVSGPFSVDTFFFLSGFLLAVYGYSSIAKAVTEGWEDLNSFGAIVHQAKVASMAILRRYLRLSALYFFILALYICGLRFIRTGPMWPVMVEFVDHGLIGGCTSLWWTNLLYINNLYPTNGANGCFSWAWYIANDFQMAVVTILMFLIKVRSKRAYWYTFTAVLVGSLLIGIRVIIKWNLKVAMLAFSTDLPPEATELTAPFDGFQHYYFKPWCRIPAYLIGVGAGFMYTSGTFHEYFFERETEELLTRSPLRHSSTQEQVPDEGSITELTASSPRTNPPSRRSDLVINVCHYGSLATMAFLVYIVWGPNNAGKEIWPKWVDVAYLAFSKSIWCVCIGWFALSLAYTKKGKFQAFNDFSSRQILKILSAPIFTYTASLVFAVYLIHPIIQQSYWGSQIKSVRVDRLFIYYHTVAFTAICFLLAFPLTLCIEIPFSRFFRILGV